MTKNVVPEDTTGIVCHFNLTFEKDWEVAGELKKTRYHHNRLMSFQGEACIQPGAALVLNSEMLRAPGEFPSSKPCANRNEVNLINLLAF